MNSVRSYSVLWCIPMYTILHVLYYTVDINASGDIAGPYEVLYITAGDVLLCW